MSDTFESISFRDESGLDPSWRDKANCKGLDPNLFYPERGDTRTTEMAKAVCKNCVVVQECLHYALANVIKHGIFGNTSEKQRRKMRRAYEKNPELS